MVDDTKHLKFDKGKPRLALVPPSLMLAVGEVLTFGANKYGPENWRNMTEIEGTISALDRHWCAWKQGELIDEESGLTHLAHMACNIAFLIELADKELPRRKPFTKTDSAVYDELVDTQYENNNYLG